MNWENRINRHDSIGCRGCLQFPLSMTVTVKVGEGAPKGEQSFLLPNHLGRFSMLVETPRTDSLRAEASTYNPKIARWPYLLAVERLFTLFDLPPNLNWQAAEAPGGHIMLNANA